ncbi:AKAP7, partial [Symbiodinium pilosum]
RYNIPEPRAARARPTHFVAIRLFSRMIRRNVQQMQQWFIAKNPLFEQCLVPVRRLHSSLLLTSIPNERRGEAQEACHEAGEEIRDMLGDQPVKIIASGISCFNGQILFTRLRTEPHDMLQDIHDILATTFMQHGFPVLDESAKSWLSEDEEPHDFKAHASFIKVSKALAHAKTDAEKRRLRSLRVTCDDLDAWRDVFFGTQICTEFELLDMIGSSRDGYYPCLKLEHFHDRSTGFWIFGFQGACLV